MGIRGPGHEEHAPVPTFFATFDSAGFQEATPTSRTIAVLDGESRARWNVAYESVTYGELVQAIDAGAMRGDPRRLYYVTYPAVGNGVIPTFLEIAVGLKVIYDIMQVTATLEDNIGFGRRLLDAARGRVSTGRQAIETNATDWRQRGADPEAIREMLGEGPWDATTLAGLLDCSDQDAQAALWAFGFAERDGQWYRDGDDEAQVVRAVMDEITLSYQLGHADFEKTLTGRVSHYLASGERAPRPFVDAMTYGDEAHAQAALENFDPSAAGAGHHGLDADHEDFEPEDEPLVRLPLEEMRLRCGCGKEDCHAEAAFGVANGKLKIGLSQQTDHFVLDAGFMGEIAENVAYAIKQAKAPVDDRPD